MSNTPGYPTDAEIDQGMNKFLLIALVIAALATLTQSKGWLL